MIHRLSTEMTWDRVFGGRFDDKDHAIDVLSSHNQDVIAHSTDTTCSSTT
jgi:hypothetical protein